MADLPSDLVSVPESLPDDLISLELPDDLVSLPDDDVPTGLLRGVSGAIFGNDPTRPGVRRLGKLVRMDAGDFIELEDGKLQAISNQDFIADEGGGNLAVFAQAPVEGALDAARRASSAVGLGVAGSTLPGVGRAVSATKPVAALEQGAESAAVKAPVSEVAAQPATQSPAGNINVNRIDAPTDVKDTLRQTAASNDEFLDARRGTISFEQTREMASLVGMTPESLSTRMRGMAFNAEQMFAARQILVNQATKVRDLAKVAKGGSDADKLKLSEELTRLIAVQEQVSGATAEAGRALSQFRMMASGTKDQINRLVEASKMRGLDDTIDKINALDDPAQVANFASGIMKAKTSDQVLEVWINSLLSGPTTQATNILSNSLIALWAIPETAIAAGISKATGSGIRANEAMARTYGILEGAKDGLRAGYRAFRTEEPTDLATKLDVRNYRSVPSVTLRKGKEAKKFSERVPILGGEDIPLTGEIQLGGKQVRLPGRALLAADEFFKAIGYRQEINALAMRTGLNEGLTGERLATRVAQLKANPPDEMIDAARANAEKQTFTNPLGQHGNAIIKLTNDYPAAKIVAPFIRTPVNIVKFAGERSPFAPLFKEVRENLKGANGAIARDQQIARIGLGSSVSAAAAYMAMEGLITGGGPSDPRERALQFTSGWQPYSFKIGDEYYSFARMEPLGMLLGVASDFVEISDAMNEEDRKSIAALIMGSVSNNLVNKTWLRGLAELIEAVQDPDRYGQRYIDNLAGTAVPTGVAQVARVRDPYLREARSALDKIKSRIPGVREGLALRRNIFGEPIKLQGSLGPDILSPIYRGTATNDPVVTEMLRLKIAPNKPGRTIRNVELNAQEYDSLQVATGRALKLGLDALVNSPKWSSLPDEEKTEFITKATNEARKLGRRITLQQFPDLVRRIVEKKAQEGR